MKISIFPKSKTGLKSVVILLQSAVLMALKYKAFITIPSFIIASVAILSFIFSLITVFKEKDYSVLIIITLLIGMFITSWVVVELVFPH